jgi:hypothetical protein
MSISCHRNGTLFFEGHTQQQEQQQQIALPTSHPSSVSSLVKNYVFSLCFVYTHYLQQQRYEYKCLSGRGGRARGSVGVLIFVHLLNPLHAVSATTMRHSSHASAWI